MFQYVMVYHETATFFVYFLFFLHFEVILSLEGYAHKTVFLIVSFTFYLCVFPTVLLKLSQCLTVENKSCRSGSLCSNEQRLNSPIQKALVEKPPECCMFCSTRSTGRSRRKQIGLHQGLTKTNVKKQLNAFVETSTCANAIWPFFPNGDILVTVLNPYYMSL